MTTNSMKAYLSNKSGILPLAVIMALVVLTYSNSIMNGFSFDDPPLLLKNQAVHGFSWVNLREIFTAVPNGLEYLPLRDLSYMLDFELWGLDPAGFHLSNLVYYLMCCGLMYAFLHKLLSGWVKSPLIIAFLATALFAVHPVHVEAVSGISQRKDVLSGIFFFLSLYCFVLYKDRRGLSLYVLSFLLFLMALLAKSTVVILPLLILLIDLFRPGHDEKLTAKLLRTLPYIAVGIAYSLGQGMIIEKAGLINQAFYGFGSGYTIRIYSSFKAIFYYLKLLLVPYPLYLFHPFFVSSTMDIKVIAGIAGLLTTLGATVYLRKKNPVLSFGIMWYLVSLVPVIGLIPSGTIIAERYLFIPSVGFCLFVAMVVHTFLAGPQARVAAITAFSSIIIVLAVLSFKRNYDWKNSISLLQANIRDLPGKPLLHKVLGAEYFQQGQYDEAFISLGRARELNPDYGLDYAVFAAIRALEAGSPAEALLQLDQIQSPAKLKILEVNFLYGLAHASVGDTATARGYYDRALSCSINLNIRNKKDVTQALEQLQAH